jgi:hypothetical protein
MTIVRIDAIVAESAQLAEFQRWLIDVPGPMRNMWLLGCRSSIPQNFNGLCAWANAQTCGEHDSRSTWSIVPGILSDPQRAILRIFYVDFNECRLCPF